MSTGAYTSDVPMVPVCEVPLSLSCTMYVSVTPTKFGMQFLFGFAFFCEHSFGTNLCFY